MNAIYMNVSKQILVMTAETENRYNDMNKQAQSLIRKQDSVQNLLMLERDSVASLTRWLEAVSNRSQLNQAGLLNVVSIPSRSDHLQGFACKDCEKDLVVSSLVVQILRHLPSQSGFPFYFSHNRLKWLMQLLLIVQEIKKPSLRCDFRFRILGLNLNYTYVRIVTV